MNSSITGSLQSSWRPETAIFDDTCEPRDSVYVMNLKQCNRFTGYKFQACTCCQCFLAYNVNLTLYL